MSDHSLKIPCEICGSPSTHLIWRYFLNLCPVCLKIVKAGTTWRRKTKKETQDG